MSRRRVISTTVPVAVLLACSGDITTVDLVARKSIMAAANYSDWSAPVSLGPVVNSTANEQNAQLSRDGLVIYFSSDRTGNLDLYYTRRASLDSPWQSPVALTALNTGSADFAPNVSIDGHLLFFASNRSGGFGGADLYVAWRDNPNDAEGWGTPVNLGAGVNTTSAEQAPNYHQNAEGGAANLYFNRGVALMNQADLYYVAVSRQGVALGPAVAAADLNVIGANEQAASLSHDGKEVFFFSNRVGGLGSTDIWTSTRQNANKPWSTPVNVTSLNTTVSDVTPNLSFDGQTMLLGTSRAPSVGLQDIFISTRTRQ